MFKNILIHANSALEKQQLTKQSPTKSVHLHLLSITSRDRPQQVGLSFFLPAALFKVKN